MIMRLEVSIFNTFERNVIIKKLAYQFVFKKENKYYNINNNKYFKDQGKKREGMERMRKEKLKSNVEGKKGITLIALVITVIIMLILAGVTISAVVGGNGLFDRIREATERYELSYKNESNQIQELLNEIDGYLTVQDIKPDFSIGNVRPTKITINVDLNEIPEQIKKIECFINNESKGIFETNQFTIENLTPETTYIVYVKVYNVEEKEYKSNPQEVLTGERKYIIKEGKDLTELTGGWDSIQYHIYSQTLPDFDTGNRGYAIFSGTNVANIYTRATKNYIDWSQYDNLKMKYKLVNVYNDYGTYGGINIGILKSKESVPSGTGTTAHLFLQGINQRPNIGEGKNIE